MASVLDDFIAEETWRNSCQFNCLNETYMNGYHIIDSLITICPSSPYDEKEILYGI